MCATISRVGVRRVKIRTRSIRASHKLRRLALMDFVRSHWSSTTFDRLFAFVGCCFLAVLWLRLVNPTTAQVTILNRKIHALHRLPHIQFTFSSRSIGGWWFIATPDCYPTLPSMCRQGISQLVILNASFRFCLHYLS